MSPTTSSFCNSSDRLPLKKRCSPSQIASTSRTAEESSTKRIKRKYTSSKRKAKSKKCMTNLKHGRWTADERKSFLLGLKLHGKGKWSLIAKGIPTRSTVQVKTHAQIILRRMENGEDVFEALDVDEKTTLTASNHVEAGSIANHDDLEDLEKVLRDNNMDDESYMDAYNDSLDDDSDSDMPSSLDTDANANEDDISNDDDADRQEDHPEFLEDYNTALHSASSRVATSSSTSMPALPVSSAYKIAPRPHFNNSFGSHTSFASFMHPQGPSTYSPFLSQSNGGNNECHNGYHHHRRTPASYYPFQTPAESSPFQPWRTYSTNVAATPATPSTNGTIFSHSSSPSPSPTMVNNSCYTHHHYVPNIATVSNDTPPIDANDTKHKSDTLPKEHGSKYTHSFEKNTYHHERYDGDDIDDESSEIAHILLGMSSPQPQQKTIFEV